MKKYIILLAVITFLFQSLLGCGLTTKQENQDFEYSKMQISMVIDIPQFLDQIATNKDEKFDSLISKLKSTNKDYLFSLLHLANKQNIELKKYFRVGEFSNELIISELRNILNRDFRQDSSTFSSRMLLSGARDIKISVDNQSIINFEFIIDTTKSPLNKVFQALLDTSRVEFRSIRDSKETLNLMKQIEKALTSNGYNKTTSDSIGNKQMTEESFKTLHPLFSIAIVDPTFDIDSTLDVFLKKSDKKTFNSYLNDPQIKKIIPENMEFLVSTIPTLQIEGENVFNVFCVNKQPSFYGNLFEDYKYQINDDSISGYLNFKLKNDEAGTLNKIVKSIESNLFLIKYVNMVYFSILKISPIDSLYFRLDGFLNLMEVDYIKTILNCGRKTLPYKIVSNSIKGVE